jgi:hypothetical protein
MTDKEIVQALRCCAEGECKDCAMHEDKQRCQENLLDKAAEAIERLTADVADLRKEIEWKDMVIAIAKRTQEEAEAERDMVIAIAKRTQAEAEAERDALLEQIKARRSCLDCKHFDYCEFDDATVIDCMSCVTKNCPCHQCSNSSHWEWRGLPEAPEEGDKHE